MLERVLETLRKAKVGRVVVVLGADASDVRKHVHFAEEVLVVNHRFSQGMSTSLKLGLAHVGREADAAIIVLGDQPFVRPTTIEKMVAAYKEGRARIVIPTFQGARGNPVLFDRSFFPQLNKIRGDVGGKAVVQKNLADVLEVDVRDAGVLADVDTPSDIGRALGVRPERSRARA